MRQFTNDDNQFKDGILAFDSRAKIELYKNHQTSEENRLYSYILLDFNLTKDIILNDFSIEKSIEVDLNITLSTGQPVKKAYVSPVKMPKRINFINSHFFTLGLSAICSFVFERPVISVKNDYYNRFEIASPEELKEIGVEFPRTIAGPGSKGFRVHEEIINLWEKRLKEVIGLIDLITATEVKKHPINYEYLMQSFRLIQLAHINKKEDFDLGYSFLIAGIESISQIAVKKIDSPVKPKYYAEWKKIAKSSDVIKCLFEEYLKIKAYVNSEIVNRDLTKRFTKFLIDYNKNSNWEEVFYDELITEGLHYRLKYPSEISTRPELHPSSTEIEEFIKIIKDTYQLRSKFFHTGLSLPHITPNNTANSRFFHIIDNFQRREALSRKMKKENRNESPFKEWSKTQDRLATYELMSYMARNSITNYLKEVLR
jgi:hypothetical protein